MGQLAWGWDDTDEYEEVRHRGAQGAFPLLWGSSISKISTILLTVMILCLVLVTTRQLGEAYPNIDLKTDIMDHCLPDKHEVRGRASMTTTCQRITESGIQIQLISVTACLRT